MSGTFYFVPCCSRLFAAAFFAAWLQSKRRVLGSSTLSPCLIIIRSVEVVIQVRLGEGVWSCCVYDRKVDQVESFSGLFFWRNGRENNFYLYAKKYWKRMIF